MTENSPLSFFSKSSIECPVCEAQFYKEELKTGRGRLNAGDITIELRRLYVPTQKYGAVYPLIYTLIVCPSCFFSVYPQDFTRVTDTNKQKLADETDKRAESIRRIFEDLDYQEPRTLKEGAASYFFALMCYDSFTKEAAPTIKQGISALRAAWLFSDLHRNFPLENYDYVSQLFYRKAAFFYNLAVEYEQTGRENMVQAGNLGPDLDKNYGYDGVLYLSAYLEYTHGSKEDDTKRAQALQNAKRTVARIFGMGRASKEKPTILLENAKDLHVTMGEEVERLTGKENP
ncbi:MAG: DUF2225 domain-containing protein [Spirochaetales bacterium]|nr:MAG: DUF2225 domain-containing protein [Spirochaetales bacterium]